jgi:hypothetical protein
MRVTVSQLAVFTLLAAASNSISTAALAAPAVDTVDMCKNSVGQNRPGDDQQRVGECTSYILTLFSNGSPPHICRDLEERGLLDDIGYATFSECLREERNFIE